MAYMEFAFGLEKLKNAFRFIYRLINMQLLDRIRLSLAEYRPMNG
jgi:hypothetical protein